VTQKRCDRDSDVIGEVSLAQLAVIQAPVVNSTSALRHQQTFPEAKRGVEGGGVAARTALDLIEEITARSSTYPRFITRLVRRIVAPGSVTSALMPLRMAGKLDPYRETARMALEPWLVEAALAHLDRRLSPAEQRTIVKATRTPHKVKWPEWWSELP
jgi:hypothetical protein